MDDNKVLDMLEKLYIEVKELRGEFNELRAEFNELRGEFNELRGEFNELRGEFNELRGEFIGFRTEANNRLIKLEIGQEQLNDKVSEAFEAIQTLAETNDKQHQEILKDLRGEMNVVELAVKRLVK